MKTLLKENIKIALRSIQTQYLRTILTVLIIAIGITALVGILTVVSALENTLSKNFASMGANTFSITDNLNTGRRVGKGAVSKLNPVISYPTAKAFKNLYQYPFCKASVYFTATTKAEVKYQNKKTNPEVSVLGIEDNYTTNAGLEIVKGRDFTPIDLQNNASVCILGADFEKNIFENTNPINKTISIRGAKFKVVGVLKPQGSTFGNSQDLRVLVPLPIARSLFTLPNINYTVSVMVAKKELLNLAIDQATLTMRKVRKLNPIEQNNFNISRSDDLLHKILGITQYLNLSAWVIGIITILGSSIALMNIMLVSVTQRTREIGTRKALGARSSTIALQFFIETLLIGQLGGLIGIVLGLGIGYLISSIVNFEFVIPWVAIITAFIISFIVAVVSGSYPAIKASKLDPIEALRYE